MVSKTKKNKDFDFEQREQREQYEYARSRIRQKKNLSRHFIFFIAGSVLFIILNEFIGLWREQLGDTWYVWAILIWLFIFLIHLLNVFVLHSFMGKEWEDRQLEKLKARQAEKISELQQKVDAEIPLPKQPKLPSDNMNNPFPDKL
ncbi:MAG: 2TM domain-containing protein [Bacteroidetes bacterium]|jgi:hypothetical protein|nr:2TM domain-containing protein [Bacteroidota bacterium]